MKDIKKNKPFFIAHWCSVLVMVALFGAYPLYVKGGYYEMDLAKRNALMFITEVGLALMIIASLVQCMMYKIPSQVKSKLSSTDIAVLLYSLVIIISSIFSIQTDTAWRGTAGWYMGGILILLLNGLYFGITRFWRDDRIVIKVILSVSLFVFFLGFLNRFTIRPIPIAGGGLDPSFISTLGNIGWYSGFMSVVATIGVSMFVLGQNFSKRKRIFLGIYTLIVFLSALSQGTDTIFLYFLVLFLGLLVCGTYFKDGIRRWLIMFMIWAISGQIIHLLRWIDDEWYNYESTNLLNLFNNKYTTLWMLIPVVICYLLVRKYGVPKLVIYIIRITPILLIVAVVIWAILAIRYTGDELVEAPVVATGGETSVKAFIHQVLYLNDNWGSGRGVTIKTGIAAFSSLSFGRKLIGVGPDCFRTFVYSQPEISDYIWGYFVDSILCNAHCEPLTSLVNIGKIGTLTYYGMWGTFIYRCSRLWKQDTRILYILLAVVSYLTYNLLNYAQLLNYPFAFILMAMGEAYLKIAKVRTERGKNDDK